MLPHLHVAQSLNLIPRLGPSLADPSDIKTEKNVMKFLEFMSHVLSLAKSSLVYIILCYLTEHATLVSLFVSSSTCLLQQWEALPTACYT